MHPLREIFSPAHPVSRSRLAGLDARIKTLAALAMILAVVMSSRMVLPLGAFGLCVILALVSRAPLGLMLRRLLAPLGFAAVVCLLRALMTPGVTLVCVQLGPWQLTATREGVFDGALLGMRVLAAASVLILLGALTPAYKVFAVLRWAGLPRSLTSIAMLMYRYIFWLFEQAGGVVSAQKVRLGYDGWGRSLASMGGLAGIVMLRSLDQADRTHQAMLARGYAGILPVAPMPPLRRAQVLALAIVLISIFALYFAAERGRA